MKNVCFILGVLFVLFCSYSVHGQINFEKGTLKDAFQKARADNKLVFLDCYTSWCGPCKKMMKEVFSRSDVGEYMNAKFVCYKQDMEKGNGKVLAERYDVSVYPTFLILTADGEIVHRSVGGQSANEFLQGMKTGCGENSLYALANRYKNGERAPKFVLQYVEALSKAYMVEDKNRVVHDYWKSLSDEERCSMDNWLLLKQYVHDVKLPEYIYLFEHKATYEKLVGKEEVEAKLFGNIYPLVGNHCNDMIFGNLPIDIAVLDEYVKLVEKADLMRKEFLLQQIHFVRFFAADDLKGALKMYNDELRSWSPDERLTATLQLNGMLHAKGSVRDCKKGEKSILCAMKKCGWDKTNPMFIAILDGLHKKINDSK